MSESYRGGERDEREENGHKLANDETSYNVTSYEKIETSIEKRV